MKKILLFLSVLFMAPLTSIFGQNCSVAQLLKTPGSWKAGIPGSIVGVNAADLAKEKEVIANIHNYMNTKFKPMGAQILHSYSYGTKSHYWSDPYSYSMFVLRYVCNKDKPGHEVEVATATVIRVSANVLFELDNLYASDLRDDFRGYLKLTRRPQLKNGFYYMSEEVKPGTDLNDKVMEYSWLITYDDILPFSYMTRKEYLMLVKAKLEKTILESPSEASYLNDFMKNIQLYLKKPESELSKVAVCMWNQEERFEHFVEEGTKGSFIAVKPNPDYYKKLPRSSPQFFNVVFKIAHGDPQYEQNLAAIQQAMDFKDLQDMLGK
jgi:hypothetical protein